MSADPPSFAAAVRVGGDPTPEELAAVLAALTAAQGAQPTVSNYERWRQTRLRALRATS